MSMVFQPSLSTTAIGSLPFADSEEAAPFALGSDLSIPFWPQLPRRSFSEAMIPQFSEQMPCVRTDLESGRTWFDGSNKFAELEDFYEKFLCEDSTLFAVSKEAAAGFYAFERLAAGRTWPFVKGQVTGPITLTTGIFDAQRRPLYSDPELRDAAVKTLVRKAEWQIGRLKRFASTSVVILVDEPALTAFGSSAYVYLSEANVCELLGEVFEAISAAGAIPGIHVCGNSDWGVLARSGARILNFDAYQYGTTIALYPDEIGRFLDGGGCIAWGIVPTSDAVRRETADSLVQRLESCFETLEAKGIARELLLKRAMLTPACGAGTLSVEDAHRVFRLLGEVQRTPLVRAPRE